MRASGFSQDLRQVNYFPSPALFRVFLQRHVDVNVCTCMRVCVNANKYVPFSPRLRQNVRFSQASPPQPANTTQTHEQFDTSLPCLCVTPKITMQMKLHWRLRGISQEAFFLYWGVRTERLKPSHPSYGNVVQRLWPAHPLSFIEFIDFRPRDVATWYEDMAFFQPTRSLEGREVIYFFAQEERLAASP